jgi:hypothetical protein
VGGPEVCEGSVVLGDDLKAVDGAEVGAWIEPALAGDWGAVTNQVPKLFEAYARVFHPATDENGEAVTWAEVARRLGRVAHPEMQWHQIVGTADTFGMEGSNWRGAIPELGEMRSADLDCLCGVLAEHASNPERCYFGLCEINHHPLVDRIEAEQGEQPRLKLPMGRAHLVLAGPLAAAAQIGDLDPPGLFRVVQVEPGEEPPSERPEPDPTDSFWRDSPSLIWPADRSWFVATEVDFDSTLVGGNRELIDALIAAAGLEVLEVEPDTLMTAFSDRLNPVPEPKG